MSTSLDFNRFKKCWLCNNFNQICIDNSTYSCCTPDCSHQEQPFESLMDVYAHLYAILEPNFHHMKSFLNFNGELRNQKLFRLDSVKKKWERHLASYPYISIDDYYPETYIMICEDIQDAATKNQLLLLTYVWLKQLDTFLGYKDYESTAAQGIFPYETRRGRLIRKYRNTLGIHVQEQTDKSIRDPNYLDLRNDVGSVFLIPNTTSSYKVEPVRISDQQHYRMKKLADDWDRVRFGFFPGMLQSFDEYDWHVEGRESGEKLFHFKNIPVEEYEKNVLEEVQNLIKNGSHFIILSELIAPLQLQSGIKELLRDAPIDGLAMTGSFHVKGDELGDNHEPEHVYNYSQILARNGGKLADVYKMNRFEFSVKQASCKSLEPFCGSTGVEQIDYSHRRLQLIVTPIGLIAVLICVDSIVDEVEEILKDYHVSMVLVMALTGNPAHSHFAEKMNRLGKRNQAVTLICNNPLGLTLGNYTDTVVAYFPIPKGVYTDKRTKFHIDVGEMYRGTVDK